MRAQRAPFCVLCVQLPNRTGCPNSLEYRQNGSSLTGSSKTDSKNSLNDSQILSGTCLGMPL